MSERLCHVFVLRLVSVLVVAVVLLILAGQPSFGAGGDLAYSKGRLWKVSGVQGETSYVFGTMHVSEPSVLDLPQPVNAALDDSSLLMVELIFDAQGMAELSDLIRLNDGRLLYDILGPDLFNRVADRLEDGAPRARLNRLQPWIVALMLSQPERERSASTQGIPFLDIKLQQEAASRGVDVVALESFTEQVAPFTSLSEEQLVAYIDASLGVPYWQVVEAYEMLRDAYLDGDLGELYRLSRTPTLKGSREIGDLVWEGLIYKRNDTMVARMEDKIARGGVFIAVGALHLPGENGILQQLADRGFTVEAVY